MVDYVLYLRDESIGRHGKVGSLGEVLPDEFVGVLNRPLLPRRICASIKIAVKETPASPRDDNSSVRADKLRKTLGLIKVNFLLAHLRGWSMP